MTESEAHKLAKSMMLRDLRGHLKDWEDGRYTFMDVADVAKMLWNVLCSADKYLEAAELQVAKKREGEGSAQVNF